MKYNFEKCLGMLLKHEGGYVDHPRDPGGKTNLGITQRTYDSYYKVKSTEQQIRDLTPADVAPIYKKRYWNRVRADRLPSGLDWSVFGWTVNSGKTKPSKAVQRFIGAKQDGSIGPKTLDLIAKYDTREIIEHVHETRGLFYESLSRYKTFGKGWTRRNEEALEQALSMV